MARNTTAGDESNGNNQTLRELSIEDVEEGDEVTITYTSLRAGTEQVRTGVVVEATTIARIDTGDNFYKIASDGRVTTSDPDDRYGWVHKSEVAREGGRIFRDDDDDESESRRLDNPAWRARMETDGGVDEKNSDVIDTRDLSIGDEVEITYDGSRGTRSIDAWIVDLDVERSTVSNRWTSEITLAEPDARRPRFLRISTFTRDAPTIDLGRSYEALKSLNSKSSRGRNLGFVEGIEIRSREERDDDMRERALHVHSLRSCEEGDHVVVRPIGTTDEPETRVVTDTSERRALTEPLGGGERIAYYTSAQGVGASGGEIVEFRRTGATTWNDEAEAVHEEIRSYGHGGHPKVVALVIDDVRYDVVWRTEPVKLASPECTDREYDHSIHFDAIGLTLVPRGYGEKSIRLDESEIELVYEGDDDEEEEDDEEETAELVTDGGDPEDLDHENVDRFMDHVDLSKLDDEALDTLDDGVTELLNGDPWDFPTDDALRSAFALSTAIRDERKNRDPRRDDPYFSPYDSLDRFTRTVYSVQVARRGPRDRDDLTITIAFEETRDNRREKFTVAADTEIVDELLDHFELDRPEDLATIVREEIPVVGDSEEPGTWCRIDRYALEHGSPAVGGDGGADLVTDGGVDVTPIDEFVDLADDCYQVKHAIRGGARGAVYVYFEAVDDIDVEDFVLFAEGHGYHFAGDDETALGLCMYFDPVDDRDAQSPACEICGEEHTELRLSTDDQPEGVNLLVCSECSIYDENGRLDRTRLGPESRTAFTGVVDVLDGDLGKDMPFSEVYGYAFDGKHAIIWTFERVDPSCIEPEEYYFDYPNEELVGPVEVDRHPVSGEWSLALCAREYVKKRGPSVERARAHFEDGSSSAVYEGP